MCLINRLCSRPLLSATKPQPCTTAFLPTLADTQNRTSHPPTTQNSCSLKGCFSHIFYFKLACRSFQSAAVVTCYWDHFCRASESDRHSEHMDQVRLYHQTLQEQTASHCSSSVGENNPSSSFLFSTLRYSNKMSFVCFLLVWFCCFLQQNL